ncbi:ketoacyl-ACP synthase III [Micromonospora sp. DPT]|uniref:3-oxoacyl-ACP synthase III family protein n=1 Tax=Micromonospora sp. DPT TaxID=3142975 RepID=UPI003209CDD0
MAVGVIGLGSHVPDRVIDNSEVCRWTGATDEWILARTGIRERRYAAPGTTTSDLALPAARQALDAVPGAAERLRALVVATATPDVPQPATAAILQHKLGLREVPAFDVNAVCSGFLYAVAVAEGLLTGRHGAGGYVLVVGADMFSTIMDRRDRRTVSLFGDGAGAVLLGEVPDGYGVRASHLVSDGELHDLVRVEAGGTRRRVDADAVAEGADRFRMDGRAVRDYALSSLRKLTERVLDEAGVTLDDVDRFVFHQANPRLLEAFMVGVGAPLEKLALTAPELGNTAAASIPVTLHAAHRQRPLRRGERILFGSVGGGMNAAATLLTWY